jgi:hypothetical protein
MSTPTAVVRIEAVVQAVILLLMGGMAGAASFVHIHDLTVQHGQPSWIGWANAIVIELMSIVAGLDIRRRKRAGQPIASVVAVLLAAVTISLAAQVATAEPSLWGWIVAAMPALGLLAVVKIVLARTAINDPSGPAAARVDRLANRTTSPTHPINDATGRPRSGANQTAGQPGGANHPIEPNRRSATPAPDTNAERGPVRPGRTRTAAAQPNPGPLTAPVTNRTTVVDPDRLDDNVIGLGRTVAAQLAEQNRPLTRDNLAEGIRAAGHTIGTDKASTLLRRLKTPAEPAGQPPDRRPASGQGVVPIQPATPVNGHPADRPGHKINGVRTS